MAYVDSDYLAGWGGMGFFEDFSFRVILVGIFTYRAIYMQTYGAAVSECRDSVVQGRGENREESIGNR